MKRAGGLYAQIIEPDNIRRAFLRAARGKQDRWEVKAFKADFNTNIRSLYDQLAHQSLNVGRYRFFTVYDPKKRRICAAAFPERVLHHAVMNVCEPVLDRYAVDDSYACRKGKGSHRAVLRAQAFARRYPWFLKLDIRKYFDSIDHHILRGLLCRRIKDKAVLGLFDQILNTYHTAKGKGLPIGNLVSQHLANFYLSGFDHWVKETLRIRGYVRYMDDFILFAQSKAELKALLEIVRRYLAETFALEIKETMQLNRSATGIPFLGYRVFAHRILLSPRSKQRFQRKYRQYEQRHQRGRWTLAELTRHMEPLIGFTQLAQAKGFRTLVMHRFGVSSQEARTG